MALTGEQLEKVKEMMTAKVPFAARSGIEIEELEKGYTRMKMPLEPNINHVGTMYAGALFTLAELPGGAIFASSFDSRRFYPIVRDMSIRFRRPATSDVSVEVRVSDEFVERIQAEADEAGKADYEWECELKDSKGEVVAVSKNVYQLRRIGS